jgi:NADPH-dependent 2,4-dienoyl-CoA reductase/sulfur reductase-like enzyme
MPEITLAKSAGFDTDKYGINIDEKSRALIKGKASEGVYASGSCAHAINMATGKRDFMYTGSTSIQRSRIISEQLLGIDARIKGSANPMISVLRNLNIGTAGLTKHEAEKNNIQVKTCVTEKKSTARYYPGGFRNCFLKKIHSGLLELRSYQEDMVLRNGLMPCRLQ